MQTVVQFLRSQTVLVVSAVLALASCFLVPPSLSYVSYVDWRVLGLLFSLMAVVAGLRMAGTFRVLTEVLLRKVTSLRLIALLLVLLCFGFSMFLTNDVTLITLVPFTLLVFRQMTGSEKALVHTLVLETLAANLGMAKYYAKEFADYLAANAGNAAIFEYPQAERLVTEDGQKFYDS